MCSSPGDHTAPRSEKIARPTTPTLRSPEVRAAYDSATAPNRNAATFASEVRKPSITSVSCGSTVIANVDDGDVTSAECQLNFEAADMEGDGYIGFKEFVAWWTN